MFGILCHRSAASSFGFATAWALDTPGKVLLFDSHHEASEKADDWNRRRLSPHVSYVVAQYPEGATCA